MVENAAVPAQPKPKRRRHRNKKKKSAQAEGGGYGTYVCRPCQAKWSSPNSLPGVTQQCKTCHAPVLPVIQPPGKGLTPYQGARRCFGLFDCTKCDKSWSSGNSWADMGQQCKDCLLNVYPYMQRPLLKGSHKQTNKRHLDEFCEKCKTLGHSCAQGRTLQD